MLNLTNHQKDLWEWFSALWAWDYNDPRPMADLIRRCGGNVPEDFLPAVADIIAGSRKPNKKAAVKLAIPASELGKLAGSLMVIRDLTNAIKTKVVFKNPELRGVHAVAEEKGRRPIDVTRDLEMRWRDTKQKAEAQFGVDVRTIEKLIREADSRIARWPNF